jgi:hypothetical protein
MTLSLEELETILSLWFKQTCTADSSITGPHLKVKVLRVAGRLGIGSFQVSYSWINHYKKIHNLVYETTLGESAIVCPETLMGWKGEELPKIISGYQLKDIFNVDEIGLFCNLH